MLPEKSNRPWPRLPGLRDADGPCRRRHRPRPQARHDLHLVRRHARSRLATRSCSTQRPTAPTSAWSTRLSTLCRSPARTLTPRSSLRDRLRDDRAPHRADPHAGEGEGDQKLRLIATTSRSFRRSRRYLTRQTCVWTAPSARRRPRVRRRPFEFIRRTTTGRSSSRVSSRSTSCSHHDRSCSSSLTAAPRSRTSTGAWFPRRQPARARCAARGLRAAAVLPVARLGSIPRRRLKVDEPYAEFDAERRYRTPGIRAPRP